MALPSHPCCSHSGERVCVDLANMLVPGESLFFLFFLFLLLCQLASAQKRMCAPCVISSSVSVVIMDLHDTKAGFLLHLLLILSGEGMLVGSYASGLLLVHSECEESE